MHELSGCDSPALGHRLGSCGAQAWVLHGTCDLPRPETEPTPPALTGGFFTSEPSGKPSPLLFMLIVCRKYDD